MSHAGALMAIIERERRRLERREARYGPLHAALRRARDAECRSAELLELAETVVVAAAAARVAR